MKYNISINQMGAYELNLNLDIVDLALMDYIKSFLLSSKCEKVIFDGKEYGWIDPDHAIAEMPLLGITTPRGINKRLDNLIAAGMIVRCPQNKSAKKTYFCAGDKFFEYDFTWNGCSEHGTAVPSHTSIIDNNNIIAKQDRFASLVLPFDSEEFRKWWNMLLQEKKWKTKSIMALQMSLDKLKGFTEQEAISAVKRSIESGWQGIFPERERGRMPQAPARSYNHVTSIDDLLK